ncbi:MAG: hypothetical protein CMK59_00240 [Proteobacteria bacterium]|nr:hypothetical protein [Pseudomonadota bacterium]
MVFIMLMVGCGEEDTVDTGNAKSQTWEWPDSAEPEEDTQELCEIEILEVMPSDGEQEVFFQSVVEVVLKGLDETASIEVLGPDGSLDGTLEVLAPWTPPEDWSGEEGDLTLVRFTPQALVASSEHSLLVSYCDDREGQTTMFTTSDWGAPVTTSVIGNTYSMTLKDGNWVLPAGAGPLVGTLFQNHLLLSIHEQEASTLNIDLGISIDDEYTQDFCFPTINALPNVDFSNPAFLIPQSDLQMIISGYSVSVYEMQITGVFREDGQSYGHGVLEGRFDARDIALTVVPDEDQLCETVSILGTPCEPCADGEEYCFPVRVEGLSGGVTEDQLECVASASCHPECLASSCSVPELGLCEF